MTKEEILSTYNSKLKVYIDLKETLERMFKAILSEKDRGIQNTSIRVKELNSLSNKIDRKEYNSIDDITDIIGVRVITYFEDDVNEIGQILSNAFEVDAENSVNKSLQLQDDQFGYKSVHYIMQFSDESCKRPEYRSFLGIKFEVQIRSILQHAWAEIEHDLKYKSEREVPSEIRRRFSRLAGLLELADEEFINIRKRRKEYRDNTKDIIQTSENKEYVEINLDSVELFISSNIVHLISAEIAERMEQELVGLDSPLRGEIFTGYVYALTSVGINTIEEWEIYMIDFREEIVRMAEMYYKDMKFPLKNVRIDFSMYFSMQHAIVSSTDYIVFKEYMAIIGASADEKVLYDLLRNALYRAQTLPYTKRPKP